MIGVQIEVNGELACTVSTADTAFLVAMLLWRTGDPLECEVRGMVDGADGSSEHVRWLSRKLKLGDIVTLRVVDADESDDPFERSSVALPSPEA